MSPDSVTDLYRPRVKICGVTDPAEALCVATAGADWIGLNFHPPSPRFISEATAAMILSALTATTARAAGLFVDRPVAEVRRIARRLGLTILQLHGSEPPEAVAELGSEFEIVRAFRVGNEAAIEAMREILERCEQLGRSPDAVLVDAYVPGHAGGTGRAIASDLLDLLPPVPRLILAGGLTPENVAERIAQVRPWMVDVASGVESKPGRKDLARVAAFLRAVRPE